MEALSVLVCIILIYFFGSKLIGNYFDNDNFFVKHSIIFLCGMLFVFMIILSCATIYTIYLKILYFL